ncbi:chemotaxis protein CheB [Piscinibacter sakaiensis]|uniref:protein-glutamate methylesterase n=1 Tax=Piscinibacter sakaiensis TaxID=1547922 RepID=A0A0K8P1T2_PISS1|nr:chemotaxis protein CheB [Piscinibacter sakaiensis]GAP36622.1 protein-glutamate methylesterase [Piscinibacter sakaiensis]
MSSVLPRLGAAAAAVLAPAAAPATASAPASQHRADRLGPDAASAASDGWAPQAIVIGASAGGVDALLRLLGGLPADFAPAVLVVLHRPRGPVDPAASLASLLGARCALPVRDAWDREPVRGGQVLIAPPDYHLLVDPGPVASLSVDEPVLYSRPAIDPLFESAAAVWGPALLAIVLSGASADGTAGARVVRRRGGRVWVQDPAEAAVPTMPQAALAGAGADAVWGLAAMAGPLQSEPFRSRR